MTGAAERQNDKGETDPKLAKRPAFASGNINLAISTDVRKLNVSAEPKDKTVEPGGTTKIDVAVTDNRGEPVANSEVAVVVVDESGAGSIRLSHRQSARFILFAARLRLSPIIIHGKIFCWVMKKMLSRRMLKINQQSLAQV